MKSSHSMTLAMTLAALGSTLLLACGGGHHPAGKIEDNPTPERAKERFAQLEDGLERNLKALREARRTRNEQAQNLCLDSIERAAEHMAGLTATING